MKCKLTKVFINTTNKDGQPLVSKDGKPYKSMSIKIEGDDSYITGFANQNNEHWKPGDEVEIEIEQKGNYKNFKMPKMPSVQEKIDSLIKRIEQIEIKF